MSKKTGRRKAKKSIKSTGERCRKEVCEMAKRLMGNKTRYISGVKG